MEKVVLSPSTLELQKTLAHGKTVIGIDIGLTSVYIAQSAVYQGKTTIIKVVVEPITISEGQDRQEVTRLALSRALDYFDAQNADVVCTISNQKVIVDYLTMPVMPEAELYDAIKIEVSNSQHFSIENPIFDYQVASRILDKNVEKTNVMVAIIAKNVIENILSYFKPLKENQFTKVKKLLQAQDFMGLNLVKFIPISIALENVIKESKLSIPETIVVLEMGSMSSELNIFKEGRLEFSRKINVSGFAGL